MKCQRLVGLGAGGHAAVIIETLQAAGHVEIIGLLAPASGDVLGIPIIGDDNILVTLQDRGIDGVFLGVGMMKSPAARKRLVDKATHHQLEIVGAVHPTAFIAPSVTIGRAPQVLAGAVIQSRARLGDHVLVNTGAIIEHDCRLGDFSHVATGAHLAGGVTVGEGAFIGAGAVLIQGVTVGANAVIGAGAVVIHDVYPGTTVVGVPARPLPQNSTSRTKCPKDEDCYALSSIGTPSTFEEISE
ncbi:acetyltransferase [bacterium]|nr:acetyltransferase [bacterium]